MKGLNLYTWLYDFVLKIFGDFSVTLFTISGNHAFTITAKNVFDALFFSAVSYVIVRLCVIAPYRFLKRLFKRGI